MKFSNEIHVETDIAVVELSVAYILQYRQILPFEKKLALKCFLHVPVAFMPAPAGPARVPVGIQTGWWPNAPRRTAQGRKCQRSPTATAWANTGALGTSFSRSEKLHPKGVS